MKRAKTIHNIFGDFVKKVKIILILISILFILLLILLLIPKVSVNPRIQILDEENQEIAYLINGHKSSSVSIDELKPKHISYILEIEDKDFFNHNGFSLPRIMKSMWYNVLHSSKQGASTITQQYIKNTYLENKKSISRKIKELYLSIKLENNVDKTTILQDYLSTIYFGNNVYGINNASDYYYSKDVGSLSDKEIISLIALWNAPAVYSNNIDKWNEKKDALVSKLYTNGILNKTEYMAALQDISLNINKEYISSNRQYYIDQVISQFKQYTYKAKFNEKIIIKTKYKTSTEKIKSNQEIDYSIICMNKQGYITTCIGNKDYNKSTFNIAIQGKRDIGSTIKPLLYYEAYRCNLEHSIFTSAPYSFSYKDDTITISNSSNLYYSDISMRTALAVSDNIYAVKMHLTLGMNTLCNHLKKYNIESNPYPSLALGSVGLSLKELICIYYQFFSGGSYVSASFISSVLLGEIEYTHTPKYSYFLDKNLVEKTKELLHAPFDSTIPHSTCGNLQALLPHTTYGKSGLTDYDSYAIGFDEENITAVWCGDMNNKELVDPVNKRLPKDLFVQTMNAL